jgi:hypothetical protein
MADSIPSVMVDLETLGTNPRSPILELACVVFTTEGGEVEDVPPFYAQIDLASYEPLKDQFEIDYGTVKWWAGKSNCKYVFSGETPLRDALLGMSLWWSKHFRLQNPAIYSQGSDFDFPILKHAFVAAGLEKHIPWKFWNQRDTRTIYSIPGRKALTEPKEVAHSALRDCRDQISMVCEAYTKFSIVKTTQRQSEQ